ncbi:tetratricopeptide repeat protein [Acuticoccus mangrovi]|uniref:Tetratricopeptide repeat protein n=1 Tax=Acuticoccus mangrovi TaxID=2796142 RepID=A0A934IS61_9HYPH|nr:hypothetical protein [Acuticoccus mangrovi]MBJ3777695.1 hypothetical protein [Acuticoccus mangrovi]
MALRPRTRTSVEDRARRVIARAETKARKLPIRIAPPLRPVVLGVAAALLIGFVLDIGPWSRITGHLLGRADAQEAPQSTVSNDLSVPSEADRAALRYFAREGAVDRLEAELRRLRALYPGWQPPRDLLDPQGEDTELQRIYDLVGEQRYDEAREAIAERRQRDPSWTPPVRLTDLLELADARARLRAANEAGNNSEVLRIAEDNERILTCDDPASIWAVAEAFAETGRPKRAYDAYAYIINTCKDQQQARASSLQKAADTLDASYVTDLFNLGATDETGQNEFLNARLDIIRGVVARGGQDAQQTAPDEWLELLADHARTGENLQDAMLVGFYLYRHGAPQEAAQWFRFALDNGLGSDAAEGYIVALRAIGDREDEFLAREVAYQWREQTPELMESYLDAMATVLTADATSEPSIFDVEQASVDRFVPVVIQQRDPNGAQALGWYAFNTCQFIIAEEWFITSANWVPTESAIYGLALARLRLGDQDGFDEVVDEWGPLYRSVAQLRSAGSTAPAPPTKAEDDPTSQIGLSSVICDPKERERLRQFFVEQQQSELDPVSYTEAGSLTSTPMTVRALTSRPADSVRPATPRRSVVIQPKPAERPKSLLHRIQATMLPPPPGIDTSVPDTSNLLPPPSPTPSLQQPGPATTTTTTTTTVRPTVTTRSGQPVRPIERRTTVVTGANRATNTGGSTVTRRVRQGTVTRRRTVDDDVHDIVNRPRTVRRRVRSAASAQAALGSGNYSACVSATDNSIRAGTLSAAEASARGFCLLQLKRPVEAAQAFQLARLRSRYGSASMSDAAYGETLASIASNLTSEAAIAATQAPMSRPRRTEVQIGILTQRAIAANRDGRYVEALYYLDQRSRIAPLQKDLMILQGFAYYNAGDYRSAERIFKAVNKAGPTSQSLRAMNVIAERNYPAPLRTTPGNGFR